MLKGRGGTRREQERARREQEGEEEGTEGGRGGGRGGTGREDGVVGSGKDGIWGQDKEKGEDGREIKERG